jgi:hypothetical protein
MNRDNGTVGRMDPLEALAADLTEAAYPIALRHGTAQRWLELELDLWKALAETLQKWKQAPSGMNGSSSFSRGPRSCADSVSG